MSEVQRYSIGGREAAMHEDDAGEFIMYDTQLDVIVCEWFEDEDDYCWHSQCGQDFVFNDGGPKANGMKFCFSCGRPLEEKS